MALSAISTDAVLEASMTPLNINQMTRWVNTKAIVSLHGLSMFYCITQHSFEEEHAGKIISLMRHAKWFACSVGWP